MQAKDLPTLEDCNDGQIMQHMLAKMITEAALRVQRGIPANTAYGQLRTFLSTALLSIGGSAAPVGSAIVANGAALTIQNSAGADQTVAATAVVVGTSLTAAKLPATTAVMKSGVKVTAPTSGTGTTGVTPTIASGAVTALVVS